VHGSERDRRRILPIHEVAVPRSRDILDVLFREISGSSGPLARRWLLLRCANETDALADYGANQSLFLSVVADRATNSIDPGCYRRFRYDPSTPDGGEQIVLADDSIAVAEQKNQQVKHLGLKGKQCPTATQLAPAYVQNIVVEQVEQRGPPDIHRAGPAGERA
jgi:hypothetical protein